MEIFEKNVFLFKCQKIQTTKDVFQGSANSQREILLKKQTGINKFKAKHFCHDQNNFYIYSNIERIIKYHILREIDSSHVQFIN